MRNLLFITLVLSSFSAFSDQCSTRSESYSATYAKSKLIPSIYGAKVLVELNARSWAASILNYCEIDGVNVSANLDFKSRRCSEYAEEFTCSITVKFVRNSYSRGQQRQMEEMDPTAWDYDE